MVITVYDESGMRREFDGIAEKRTLLSTTKRATSHSRLHNFSFPSLSWGNQKLLRCVNLSNGSMAEELEPVIRRPSPSFQEDVRPVASSASKPPSQIRGHKRRMDGKDSDESTQTAGVLSKHWNLRSRREVCNVPMEIGQNLNHSDSSPPSLSPSLSPLLQENIVNPVRMLRSRMEGIDKAERRKFSIPLTRGEIEEDFIAMKGAKPSRRPKKRARCLQRHLDIIFPGSFLTEVTPDLYKIDEKIS